VTRVLVVDDFADTARAACVLLTLRGHEAHAALSAQQAIAAALDTMPEVALLDICLPDMSGFELVGRLRALPGGRQLVCIALTGWGMPEDIERARQAGFDHYLLKPVGIAALASILTAASHARRALLRMDS
jgi:CheY-like chemotaxis protein